MKLLSCLVMCGLLAACSNSVKTPEPMQEQQPNAGAGATTTTSNTQFVLKGNWTGAQAKEEGNACVYREVEKGVTDKDLIKKICYCAINKVMEKYPQYNDYENSSSASDNLASFVTVCGGK